MTPKRLALVLFALVVAGVGCEGSSEPSGRESAARSTLVFPVQGPRNSVMQALFEGVVTRDGDCLRLTDNETVDVATPVWPPGFTYEEREDQVVILDETGTEVAQTGQSLKMGGGLVGEAEAEISKELGELVRNCPAPYWIVGEI